MVAPISVDLPAAKGRRRHSDKDSDKFRKTDQLPMMVSQCPAACPACLGTHIGLGHRLCHQRPAGHQWTPMDTNGHQWTSMDTRTSRLSEDFRQSQQQAGPLLADTNYHGNLHQKWFIWSGGILETKLCASCNQSGHFFVNSSRAECFARFYASEKEAVIVATRAHKFSARFITPLLRLRLLKYNYAENPKATEEAL